MSTELKPAAINGIIVNDSGEYQFDRTDIKSRPVAINFLNLGNSSVDIKIGGYTFRLATNEERTFSAPTGYYLKGGATYEFVSRASSMILSIATIEAL